MGHLAGCDVNRPTLIGQLSAAVVVIILMNLQRGWRAARRLEDMVHGSLVIFMNGLGCCGVPELVQPH